jgi:glycosyltransferase involved in cell wall biosynthesis
MAVKIAHITTVDASLRYLLLDQMRAFRQAGYTVTGISAPGDDVLVIEAGGVRHIAVTMSRSIAPLQDLRALWKLYRTMRRERFDIVHTHTPKAGLLGQLAAKLARVPIVVNTIHGFYFHDLMPPAPRRFYILMEKLAGLCSDAVLSQNQEDIATALREGIIAPHKLTHLGNGINLAAFDRARFSAVDIAARRGELGLAHEAPVIGFVGRLAGTRKGFYDFLAAAHALSAAIPGARFLIVGEPERGKPDAVEPAEAADYGIADACLFLGQRPNAELPLLYSLMDVIVLPSIFEGMPRAIMEAAAMGVPAVVSDVKGNREVVDDGVNGFRVPYGDVPALTAALLRLLHDRPLAASMGRRAREVAERRFDERLVFARVADEYARLLAERRMDAPRAVVARPQSALVGTE